MTIQNRTIFTGDNLDIMRGMNSNIVDLIYLDPPFNSNKNYSAPIGSKAAGAAFKDTWTLSDIDEAWHGEIAEHNQALYEVISASRHSHGKGMMSYLIMMGVRLLEMKRILKPTGSIYLHCDPTASHYLKMLMDSIFGSDWYRNEIVWGYRRMPSKSTSYQKMHDTLLFYRDGKNGTWGYPTTDPSPASLRTYKSAEKRGYNANINKRMVTVWNWDKYHKAVEDGILPPDMNPTEFKGGRPPERDWWIDIKLIKGRSLEGVGYPTQKPLKLLERIIKASSNPGDLVMDPFCGCATACVAAENLDRQWIGIDISEMAPRLIEQRLEGISDCIHRTDIPTRTEFGKLPNYRTHKHQLYGKQEGNCFGCIMHFPFRNLTVDHIVPKSKGGQDNYENLQLLCGACNSIKGNRPHEYLVARLRETGIRP